MWILLFAALAQTVPDAPPIPEESIKAMRDAYVSGDTEAYVAQLRHHLSQAPNDPDVAFLYAHYLGDQGDADAEEAHRWSSVALAHRERMTSTDTTLLLQRLHHVRLKSSLDLWNDAIAAYEANPSEENAAVVERWNRRTQHYFAASGACLVNGECGPRWTTEVEGGGIVCNELDLLELEPRAETGTLGPGEVGCLERIYQRRSKKRIRRMLVDNALAAGRESTWERLLAWDGEDDEYDPEIVQGWLDYLGAVGNEEAIDTWRAKLEQ